ncbi:nucleic acid binding protein [Striga asiatica]|uniref:Nucleic acid binding protein n=1 Tax=Striga asiatica TaxID=4170 RepID=A0A5A7PVW0_STRAF|nr:nucleic acid binding protein [Striga asiatica]
MVEREAMFLSPQQKLFMSHYSKCSRAILKDFLLLKPTPAHAAHELLLLLYSCSSCSQAHSFHSCSRKILSFFANTAEFPAIYQRAAGFSQRATPYAAMTITSPTPGVGNKTLENQCVDEEKEEQLIVLKQKLLEIGINPKRCLPGQYNGLICPKCKVGKSEEKIRSLSLRIEPDGRAAVWTCSRAKCNWKGTTQPFANVTSNYAKVDAIERVKQPLRIITEEILELEPLCDELLAYFAERRISVETLQRNCVMQKRSGDKVDIAFTYRRNGELVSCKYRTITKTFWQEPNTEKIFYGLDDIKEESNIIIVDGEMNKLSMEEAGFRNCVSVPFGAPSKVSNKALPSEDEDKGYRYLWNCQDYMKKATRIILAMDNDHPPGRALAEELARCLGRERCWSVKWPKKDDTASFKDVNEVLMHMGPDALRDVIEAAELYPILQDPNRPLNNYLANAVADVASTYAKANSLLPRIITEESLELEPLCTELLAYFADRMISGETLRRNCVMQKRNGDKIAIAFTYRRNGELISCKYCGLTKRFWQVEGEMDKLSMEEAGFKNCVSVPDGAPSKVSNKGLPSKEADKRYRYLWNCKHYMEKVLMHMGPDALRDVIEAAELYPIRGLFNFKDYRDEIDDYSHPSLCYELGATVENQFVDEEHLIILRQKLQEIGFDPKPCLPGKYNSLICPRVCGSSFIFHLFFLAWVAFVRVGKKRRRAYLFVLNQTGGQLGTAFEVNVGGMAQPECLCIWVLNADALRDIIEAAELYLLSFSTLERYGKNRRVAMLLSPKLKLFLNPYSNCSRAISMASKDFLLLKTSPAPAAHARVLPLYSCSQARYFHSNSRKNVSFFSNTRHLPAIYQKAYGYSYSPCAAMPISRPISGAGVETVGNQFVDEQQLIILRQKLHEIGFDPKPCLPGQYHSLMCPRCKGGDSEEKSLSLFIEPDGRAAVWYCFRGKCGWTGATRAYAGVSSTYAKMNETTKVKQPPRKITEESLELGPLCKELLQYFAERLISGETLRRNGVMQKKSGEHIAIAFTYRRNGELVSCKYRDITKKFWQVEGEIDKLSMEEAGFRNCVSVPDGAPSKVSNKGLPSEDEDTKYQFLWNCKEYTDKASRIILATDDDSPGQALAEEIARRLGKERCWKVKWPQKNDTECFKDANEVLMYMGADALRGVIEAAEPYPIRGLFNFKDYYAEIDDYYHMSLGYELGVSTGWRDLNDLYNVVPGELTIVTGIPNSGKSEWIDALLCNLNHSVGWKFALCSMENRVREHARKLLEKHIRKPFFDIRYGQHIERMSVEELELGKKWLSDSFSLIRCENDCLPSTDWVLNLAKIAVLRHGVNGLVIDPYNELDHQRPHNHQMLTKVKRFAQHHSCHVWFVAHPRQLHNWVGGPPNMYDISGSAHFINKCDNGIVIHRNRDPEAGPVDLVQVCVRKVRNKVIGTIGDAYLTYNRVTGEYGDIDKSSQNEKRR